MQGSSSFQQRLNASAEEMSGGDYGGDLYLIMFINKEFIENLEMRDPYINIYYDGDLYFIIFNY